MAEGTTGTEETKAKRRTREPYSRLICLGCRARRIRCALPDTSIEPSAEPQPVDKACHRCQQNGLECVVDFTTLGRPTQKRNRIDQANSNQHPNDVPSIQSDGNFEESISEDVDGFLLVQPDGIDESTSIAHSRQQRPSKSEICDSMISPFHLICALLSRDEQFAASISSRPLVKETIVETVDEQTTAVLDSHLVWHRFYNPDIPSLLALRGEIKTPGTAESDRISTLYLLTLLCDLALDVPSVRLARYRHLQPAVRALTYHWGQQLFFTLPRHRYTVLALILTAEYRPLALTGSQLGGLHALKAIPHVLMAKYIASELGYQKAGSRLTLALNDVNADEGDVRRLMHECIHWIHLSLVEDVQTGILQDWVRRMDSSALECLDALTAAIMLDRLPADLLCAYSSVSCLTQLVANIRDMTENWRDLDHLGEVINGHKVFCDNQKEILESRIERSRTSPELTQALYHNANMLRHWAHTSVTGAACFFAIMYGAHSQSHRSKIGVEDAIKITDNLIEQLTLHSEDDPARPAHRRFLESYGVSSDDNLERCLTDFITAADTLSLDGIPFVGGTRNIVSRTVKTCKDIVEGQAARMKGWGGMHDRVDVYMILFQECARRLESMSASAGTEEAFKQGCLLTAAAKLIRSLHRILQGFKKTILTTQWRNTADSSKTNLTPSSIPTDLPSLGETTNTTTSSNWDNIVGDDLFTDWNIWPQFDAFDFSDLFGNAVTFDPEVVL